MCMYVCMYVCIYIYVCIYTYVLHILYYTRNIHYTHIICVGKHGIEFHEPGHRRCSAQLLHSVVYARGEDPVCLSRYPACIYL